MDYRKTFYRQYISAHTSHRYGVVDLCSIERQFAAWHSYFKKYLPQNSEAAILDIGCGEGGFIHWLQNEGYRNVEGIDTSSEQVRLAEKLGILGIREGDLFAALEGNEDKYDVVVARDVLEHLTKEEVLEALNLIRANLRLGGVFIAQTVNAESPFMGRIRYGDFTHELAFTAASMEQLLRAIGFSEIKIMPQRPVAHGIVSFGRFLLWGLIEIVLHFYLLVETGARGNVLTQNLIVCARK